MRSGWLLALETGERPDSPTSRSYLRSCVRGVEGTKRAIRYEDADASSYFRNRP